MKHQRQMKAKDFLEPSRWNNSHEFLFESANKWPKLDIRYDSLPADDFEIKKGCDC